MSEFTIGPDFRHNPFLIMPAKVEVASASMDSVTQAVAWVASYSAEMVQRDFAIEAAVQDIFIINGDERKDYEASYKFGDALLFTAHGSIKGKLDVVAMRILACRPVQAVICDLPGYVDAIQIAQNFLNVDELFELN